MDELYEEGADPIMGFAEHRFLSNFYPCEIEYQNVKHRNTETAYVAAKTDDYLTKVAISEMTPGKAKRFGRTLELPEDWGRYQKVIHMINLTSLKYEDEELSDLLISTWPRKIVEANTWNDRFWGTDMDGNGPNKLGIILMVERLSRIRKRNGVFCIE